MGGRDVRARLWRAWCSLAARAAAQARRTPRSPGAPPLGIRWPEITCARSASSHILCEPEESREQPHLLRKVHEVNLNIMTPEDAAAIGQSVKQSEKSAQVIATEGQQRRTGKTPQVTADDAYTRILKYIPAPLIGLYLLIVNALLGSLDETNHHDARRWACWIILVVFAALIAAYLHNTGVKRTSQIVVSILAYLAWAAASPGPFQLLHWWNDGYATAALGVVLAIAFAFQLNPLPDTAISDMSA